MTAGTVKRGKNGNSQKSVTATFKRTKLPKGNGGVRFEESRKDRVTNALYVNQDAYKAMGSPEKIRQVLTAV